MPARYACKSFAQQHLRTQAAILAIARITAEPRPLRPERNEADAQVVGVKGFTSTEMNACPRSCLECRQGETVLDNSGQDACVSVGVSEVLRMISRMTPEDRGTLVGFLKAMA